jgi:hypothetical protein
MMRLGCGILALGCEGRQTGCGAFAEGGPGLKPAAAQMSYSVA